MMRILVATDAWHPQVNGVVRTLTEVARCVKKFDAEVVFITPDDFPTVPLPSYPGLRVALPTSRKIAARVASEAPSAIHVATEGPIGHWVRLHCRHHGLPFTTSFHTRFPEYVSARLPIPESWTWAWLRRFHNAGAGVMAATPALQRELVARGFRNIMLWPRGVNCNVFCPRPGADLGLPRPVFLAVSRLAVEKNIEAFLSLQLPGTQVVVGDGPARRNLERRFPAAVFLGTREGEALATTYAAADVFVFPSRTDTFGLVLLEALACGVPIAAYEVAGPRDVIGDAGVGVLAADLGLACMKALTLSRHACRQFARDLTWHQSAGCFVANVRRYAGPLARPGAPAAVALRPR
jgi:glycosyltransferase involved in cell wall biosynthesis